MLRTGVDIIEIARVEQAARRFGEQFYRRIFTEQERAYCQGRFASLAARYAAKEAVTKALGTGIGDVAWVEIEVALDARGAPALMLHGAAARLAGEIGLREWSISLSHSHDYAVAFVVASD